MLSPGEGTPRIERQARRRGDGQHRLRAGLSDRVAGTALQRSRSHTRIAGGNHARKSCVGAAGKSVVMQERPCAILVELCPRGCYRALSCLAAQCCVAASACSCRLESDLGTIATCSSGCRATSSRRHLRRPRTAGRQTCSRRASGSTARRDVWASISSSVCSLHIGGDGTGTGMEVAIEAAAAAGLMVVQGAALAISVVMLPVGLPWSFAFAGSGAGPCEECILRLRSEDEMRERGAHKRLSAI